jgi:hypothetical protein
VRRRAVKFVLHALTSRRNPSKGGDWSKTIWRFSLMRIWHRLFRNRGSAMKRILQGINPDSKPTGNGCEDCLKSGGWWLHLRRCAECGYIGCCDSSPNQHAAKHAAQMGHPVVASFEPLQNWFYDYSRKKVLRGPRLVGPRWRPETQSAPGPEGRVPRNWESLLHDIA